MWPLLVTPRTDGCLSSASDWTAGAAVRKNSPADLQADATLGWRNSVDRGNRTHVIPNVNMGRP